MNFEYAIGIFQLSATLATLAYVGFGLAKVALSDVMMRRLDTSLWIEFQGDLVEDLPPWAVSTLFYITLGIMALMWPVWARPGD